MESDCWFKRAAGGAVRTGQTTCLMNIVNPRLRREVRKNFFSMRIVDSLNNLLEEMKMARSLGRVRRLYSLHGSNWPGRETS
jgi:hypothetical protein